MEQATLKPVDSAELAILVDTFVDILLAGNDVARRAPLAPLNSFSGPPWAVPACR